MAPLPRRRLQALVRQRRHEPILARLRLAYWVAQVCNADAPDHRRVAKDDWRAGEAVEESNSGAKQNRRDVDVDFVEEPSIQALLDGVGAVDTNGFPRRRRFWLGSRRFRCRRTRSGQSSWVGAIRRGRG